MDDARRHPHQELQRLIISRAMLRLPTTAAIVICLASAAAGVGACGSTTTGSSSGAGNSGGQSSTTSSSTSSSRSGQAALPDPCTLLTSSDVSGLGVSAGPTLGPKQTATDALPESSCTWGSAIDATGMVSVVVSTPHNGADAGDLLANGANGTSVSAGPDGKLLARAVIAGGGGVGKTIIFHKSGITVLVAKVGDNVDDGALTAAANSAAGRL
jgi:hypothetical protein